MEKEEKRNLTKLSEIGEFGVIEHITENVKIKHPETIKGIGDDAAVLDYKDKQIVVTTDLLTEGVHFNLIYFPLKHLGYKAAIVNFSDILAMNAIPRQITVSLAISQKFSLQAIEQLYSGITLACEKYKVDLIGGDTTSSMTGLTISITAIGEADSADIVYRNSARKNDLVFVSGDLGGAYMGLQLLERENQIFAKNPEIQPQFEGHDYILERQLKPEARKDIIRLFKEHSVKPTSMIDISDGLSSEILHICSQSNVGCKIYEDKIPVNEETSAMAEELNMDTTICALSGGEDYELLFTLSMIDYEKIKSKGALNDVSVIGYITGKEEAVHLIARDGTEVPVTAQGWNAFDE